MKEVAVGEGKVLLLNDGGTYRAIGANCTHYGAPLANGMMCPLRIIFKDLGNSEIFDNF